MDGLHAMLLRELYNPVNIQVALHRRDIFALANAVRLVGLIPMRLQAVLWGIDSHCARADLSSCAEDANRNFATVGAQDLLEHLG